MLDAGIACENYSHILRSVIDITEMGRIYTSANIAIQRCLCKHFKTNKTYIRGVSMESHACASIATGKRFACSN